MLASALPSLVWGDLVKYLVEFPVGPGGSVAPVRAFIASARVGANSGVSIVCGRRAAEI
jgi:hypothetical protein